MVDDDPDLDALFHTPDVDLDDDLLDATGTELDEKFLKTPAVSSRMMDCGRDACDSCPHGPYLFVGGEYRGHAEFNDPPDPPGRRR